MTDNGGYATGAAMWRAARDRAKATAKSTGAEPDALLRQFVRERFLARVFHDPAAPWVLKGGTAVLARVSDARTTRDLDLLAERSDLDAAVESLRRAAEVNLQDHFRFQITKVKRNPGGAGQPAVDGRGVSIDGYCGAQKVHSFGVDVVTGSLMTATPDIHTDAVLNVRGLEAPTVRLYPLVDHIADKLCATQATYGTAGQTASTRERDLVDLVVFARTQDVDGSALLEAVRGEWNHRGMPGVPVFAPPPDWVRRYSSIARKVPAVGDVTTFADAVALVGDFLAPVLDGQAAGQRWIASERAWQQVELD